MHSFLVPFLAAVNTAVVLAAPSATIEPCAVASAAVEQSTLTDKNGYPIISADVAYACLKSVPVDTAGDLKQLQGLRTLWNFQSDFAYVKDPPPGWLHPPVDVLGVLDSMILKIQNGQYSSEYDVQFELWQLASSVYDFHFIYRTDILADVFSWARNEDLISVSADGTSLPEIYAFSDIAALNGLNGTRYTPSPVVKINGTDVETWINQYAGLEPWDHDLDANYNNVFYNVPAQSIGKGYGSQFSTGFYHFPGTVTVLTFANGSTDIVASYASVYGDLTGVTDGASFFQKFCVPATPSASASATASATASVLPSSFVSIVPSSVVSGSATASIAPSSAVTTNNLYTPVASASPIPAPSFYPVPAVIAPDTSIAGFFPEGYDDLAVVTVPTFQPANDYTFQNKLRTFLATAKSLGKTKLIIDVRANGGGTIVDGFSFFKELFPSMVAYGGANLAAWPLLDALGEVASGFNDTLLARLQALNTLSVQEDLNINNQEYQSWSDFYGPIKRHGGEFTNLRRNNFSSPFGLGPPLYGYINDTIPQPQTFQPENMVILSDGFCGSTCSIFSELMKTQGGVKSITFGGRKQYCPMQSVGGSKGSNDQEMVNLITATNEISQVADEQQRALFAPYIKAGLVDDAKQVLNRGGSNGAANVNFLNQIRKGDDSVTPLMFVYEASNCRAFYTPQMILDQSLVWAKTYKLQWGNDTCVKGSTGEPSAVTGFDSSYFSSAPPSCAKNIFGAQIKWSYPAASTPPVSASSTASSGPSSTANTAPAASATGGASNLRAFTAGGCLLVTLCCGMLF